MSLERFARRALLLPSDIAWIAHQASRFVNLRLTRYSRAAIIAVVRLTASHNGLDEGLRRFCRK
jgi:hypothetical protein